MGTIDAYVPATVRGVVTTVGTNEVVWADRAGGSGARPVPLSLPGDELSPLLVEARRQLAEQAHRTQLLAWQLESIRHSRLWRLSVLLRELRRHPTRVVRFPADVVRALRPLPSTAPPEYVDVGALDGLDTSTPLRDVQPVRHDRVVRPGVTAATILSRDTAAGFQPEWRQLDLTPESWRRRLKKNPPDLLLVESIGDEHPWAGQLVGPNTELARLLDWCRRRSVPTVFWSTADPAGFETYTDVAPLFDVVWTVDPDMLPRYHALLGHDRIGWMPYAVQTRRHNPLWAPGSRTRDVAKPSTSHSCKTFKVFEYDESSAPVPPTVLPREVLEFAACGTAIAAPMLPGLVEEFGEAIAFARDPSVELRTLVGNLLGSAQLRDRLAHQAQRIVLDRHTYSHRVDALLRSVGRTESKLLPTTPPPVSVLLPVVRPAELSHAIDQVARQRHRPLQLVVVPYGNELDTDGTYRLARAAGIDDVIVLPYDRSLSLGRCIGRAMEAADGKLFAKFDDDSMYGDNYLSDLVNAFVYTDAGVVGKGAHYTHFQASGATVLRYPEHEHCYTRMLHGGTITARADVMRRIGFADVSVGEDTEFLANCAKEGIRIYAADRFSFCWLRQSAPGNHSWQASESELLRNGLVEFFGYPDRHVNV